MSLSKDQQRVKRNIYLKAIRNFEEAVGSISIHELCREHAMQFRSWWVNRIEETGLKPYTANREINSLRRMLSVNFDIDGVERVNPFQRVKLKESNQGQRKPFTSDFIQSALLKPGNLSGLPDELSILVRMLVNTGARPSELIGLESEDVSINAEIPFIHIRKNGTRSLKTEHSERQIPLLGVLLEAAQEFGTNDGWGKWLGKNMYATTVINKFFREQALVTEKEQSLYTHSSDQMLASRKQLGISRSGDILDIDEEIMSATGDWLNGNPHASDRNAYDELQHHLHTLFPDKVKAPHSSNPKNTEKNLEV